MVGNPSQLEKVQDCSLAEFKFVQIFVIQSNGVIVVGGVEVGPADTVEARCPWRHECQGRQSPTLLSGLLPGCLSQ